MKIPKCSRYGIDGKKSFMSYLGQGNGKLKAYGSLWLRRT